MVRGYNSYSRNDILANCQEMNVFMKQKTSYQNGFSRIS